MSTLSPKVWRRALGVLVVTLTVVALAVFLTWRTLEKTLQQPFGAAAEGVILEVPAGASARRVADSLKAKGLITSSRLFTWEARRSGLATRIKSGEYALNPEESARELLQRMVAGDVVTHRLTIVEGVRVREALEQIRSHPMIAVVEPGPIASFSVQALVAMYALPFPHPEGALFPDTYVFPRGTTDVALVAQARDRLTHTLETAWASRAADSPLKSPYEALILASIVEKETGLGSERARISGVFSRRLARGMRLQTDPTVIYGIGAAFDGNLTRDHLKTPTPYNTYVNLGLPPTPIALVGEAAIAAALAPATGDALYFVARGDGSHAFSPNYAAHQKAVRKYQLRGSHTLKRTEVAP